MEGMQIDGGGGQQGQPHPKTGGDGGGGAPTRRPNRVRSNQRKRGCRGSNGRGGKKKQEQKAARAAEVARKAAAREQALKASAPADPAPAAVAGAGAAAAEVASAGGAVLEGGSAPMAEEPGADPMETSISVVDKPRKRVRERKNRTYKPFSEMDWKDRMLQEKKEEERAQAAAAAAEEGAGKPKKRKRGRKDSVVEVPKAPRNPTQNLLHANSDVYEDEVQGAAAAPMPTMYGMLSQETMRLARKDEESSDEDDEEADRIYEDLHQQGVAPLTYAMSPASPPADSPESPHEGGESAAGAHQGGQNGAPAEQPDRVSALEAENRRLRERLAELEAALRAKDGK